MTEKNWYRSHFNLSFDNALQIKNRIFSTETGQPRRWSRKFAFNGVCIFIFQLFHPFSNEFVYIRQDYGAIGSPATNNNRESMFSDIRYVDEIVSLSYSTTTPTKAQPKYFCKLTNSVGAMKQ